MDDAAGGPAHGRDPAGTRVALFGGAGFIGRHAQRALIGRGARVTVCDLAGTQGGALPGAAHRAIAFGDPATYRDVLAECDAAVLLVSASVPGTFASDLPGEIAANVDPYARFVQALRDRDREGLAAPHLVYLSSGGTVYGRGHAGSIAEDAPLHPISPYGVGKLAIEAMLRTAPGTHTVLRPSNPIGPGQDGGRGQGIVAVVLDRVRRGEPIEIWGDGLAVRDYFDVRDLAEAIAGSVGEPAARDATFNVGSGIGRTTLDVLAEIEAVIERPVPREHRPARPVDVPSNVLDIGRIEATLGWRPARTLRGSIADMLGGDTARTVHGAAGGEAERGRIAS